VTADNTATKTGRYAARDAVTSPRCSWCARKKRYVRGIYSGGGQIEGELFTKNSYTTTGSTDETYSVTVATTVSQYREVDGSGHVPDKRGDRKGLPTLTVGLAGGSWKVVKAIWQPT